MAQDLNSTEIDSVSLCNLALETCALAADTNFQNIDLVTRSLAYFLESIELDNRNYAAHLGLGILLLGGQMYDEAIQYLQNAYDLNPIDDVSLYLDLAQDIKSSQKSVQVEGALVKKKATVNDLLDMGNKFKFK